MKRLSNDCTFTTATTTATTTTTTTTTTTKVTRNYPPISSGRSPQKTYTTRNEYTSMKYQ
jgi:hypothetical protein